MRPEIYEGNEKYIFISYAHKDSDTVLSVISAIDQAGYRVWYDDGIEAGSEWPETIAQHLDNAAAFIVFISPNAVVSDNCRNEINFAISRKKPFLSVFIEDTEVPLGIELQIASKQGVIRSKCRSQDEFISKIINSEIIAECRRTEWQNESAGAATSGQEPEENESENTSGAEAASKSGLDIIGSIRTDRRKQAALCAVALLIIAFAMLMNNMKNNREAEAEESARLSDGVSEAVSESVDKTAKEVYNIAAENGEEEEPTESFDYSFDYPSFSGKEITVSDSKELENALRDAANGDTIKIKSGEYETDRTLFIDKQIRFCGAGGTKPVIHGILRVRTEGVMIDNIEISITDSSQTYDSEYREDRLSCIETDGMENPTYIRDVVINSRNNIGCDGIRAYGGIVMENSYINTDSECMFLSDKAELNGNTFSSGYCGILVWGLYGEHYNPAEKQKEFRKNNTFEAPTDVMCDGV